MHYKYLLGSVALIIVVLAGIYFFVNQEQRSDYGTTEMDEQSSEPQVTTTTEEETTVVEAPSPEVDLTEDAVSMPVSSASAPVSTQTPTPAPAPVPTPTPIPTPAPTPSGYTLAQVSVHGDASSCWTIIGDSVYDVTSFIGKHPGGESKILRICGKNGTGVFEAQHGGESRPESTLTQYRIGAYEQ
jgi:cytochrome b involved in lipid metabolism